MSAEAANYQASPLTSSWSPQPEKRKHDAVVASDDLSEKPPRKHGGWKSMVYILGLWIQSLTNAPVCPILHFRTFFRPKIKIDRPVDGPYPLYSIPLFARTASRAGGFMPNFADYKSKGWIAVFLLL